MSEEADLKQKKLEEMQEKYLKQKEEEQKQEETERKMQAMMRQLVDERGLERLNNVKIINGQLYMKAFQAVVTLAQRGYVKEKLNEEQVKQILAQLKDKREISIKRK